MEKEWIRVFIDNITIEGPVESLIKRLQEFGAEHPLFRNFEIAYSYEEDEFTYIDGCHITGERLEYDKEANARIQKEEAKKRKEENKKMETTERERKQYEILKKKFEKFEKGELSL